MPLHAYVWLDESDIVVRQLSVSLLCERTEAEPGLGAQPTDPNARGLSESGMAGLRGLCGEFGFSSCNARNPGEVDWL
jgi:hypothetical protein